MPSVPSELSSVAPQYSQAATRARQSTQDAARLDQDQSGPFAMLLDTPQDAKPPEPAPRDDRTDAARDRSDNAAPADNSQKADSPAPAKDSKVTDAKGGSSDVKDTKETKDTKTDGKTAKTGDGKDAKKADAAKNSKKAAADATLIGGPTDPKAKPADATPQAAAIPVAVALPVAPVPVPTTTPATAAADANQLAAAAAAATPGGPKATDAKPVQAKSDAPAKGDAPAKTATPTTQAPDGTQIEAGKDTEAGVAAAPATPADHPAHHPDAEKLLAATLNGSAAPSDKSGDAAAANAGTTAAQNLAQTSTTQAAAAPVQAAAANLAPAAAPVPIAGLAVEIASQASAGNNHFAIRLDPPDLGRIDVHLDVDKGGNITTHVVADRQDTLDLLRRDQTQLERSLQDAGLKTGDNSMQFSLRDQSFAGRDDNNNAQNTARIVVPEDNPVPLEAMRQGYGRLLGLGGGLDIKV